MPASISAIIPVYNGAQYIRDALTSLCAQTYLPKEIIVADDVSTDNTREIVSEFAKKSPVPVTLFSMEKNTGGPYKPANRGVAQSSGKYVALLDADDMFSPEAFAELLATFERNPDAGVGAAVCDFLHFRGDTGDVVMASSFKRFSNVLARAIACDSPDGVVLERQEALRATVYGFAIPFRGLITRDAWSALGGYNTKYEYAGDSEFTWRLISQTNYRIRLINRPFNRVRVTPDSMSANQLRMARELAMLYRDMIIRLTDPELLSETRRRLRKELYDLAYIAYKKRKWASALLALCRLACERIRGALTGRSVPLVSQ